VGVFTFLGSITQIVIILAGGYLFYEVGYNSPMLMESGIRLVVLIVSHIVSSQKHNRRRAVRRNSGLEPATPALQFE
jgi:hypothetical protein